MKGIHLDPHRGYRERCAPRDGEHGFQLVIGETDLRVTAVSPLPEGFKDALAARVRTLRGELEAWIVLHPEFRHSLVPVQLSCSAPPPEIVRRMTEASAIAGWGVRGGGGDHRADGGGIARGPLSGSHYRERR